MQVQGRSLPSLLPATCPAGAEALAGAAGTQTAMRSRALCVRRFSATSNKNNVCSHNGSRARPRRNLAADFRAQRGDGAAAAAAPSLRWLASAAYCWNIARRIPPYTVNIRLRGSWIGSLGPCSIDGVSFGTRSGGQERKRSSNATGCHLHNFRREQRWSLICRAAMSSTAGKSPKASNGNSIKKGSNGGNGGYSAVEGAVLVRAHPEEDSVVITLPSLGSTGKARSMSRAKDELFNKSLPRLLKALQVWLRASSCVNGRLCESSNETSLIPVHILCRRRSLVLRVRRRVARSQVQAETLTREEVQCPLALRVQKIRR